MIPPDDIGIAYLDHNDRELASIGGAHSVDQAAVEAQAHLQQGTHRGAVKAVIYAGRSYSEGETLRMVTR